MISMEQVLIVTAIINLNQVKGNTGKIHFTVSVLIVWCASQRPINTVHLVLNTRHMYM